MQRSWVQWVTFHGCAEMMTVLKLKVIIHLCSQVKDRRDCVKMHGNSVRQLSRRWKCLNWSSVGFFFFLPADIPRDLKHLSTTAVLLLCEALSGYLVRQEDCQVNYLYVSSSCQKSSTQIVTVWGIVDK